LDQKPQFSARGKKDHLDLDYFPSKKRAGKVDTGADTDRCSKLSGYAVDSLADSASKQGMDSARKMITNNKAAICDNLDIAYGIRQISQNSARESRKETADNTEGTKELFRPDSARSQAQISRLQDRP